jgi:hypothetical protein
VALVEIENWLGDGELKYRLELPSETPSNNVIKGMNRFTYKALRQEWQYRILEALKFRRPKAPIERSVLFITRYCSGELDWDNALGGLKPVLDCLVLPSDRNPSGLGLITDDKPKYMPYPPYMRQLKTKPGAGRTEVLIFALSN